MAGLDPQQFSAQGPTRFQRHGFHARPCKGPTLTGRRIKADISQRLGQAQEFVNSAPSRMDRFLGFGLAIFQRVNPGQNICQKMTGNIDRAFSFQSGTTDYITQIEWKGTETFQCSLRFYQ
jgi:hypothetical protein